MRLPHLGYCVAVCLLCPPASPLLADPPTPVFWASGPTTSEVERIHSALSGSLTERGLEFQGAPLSEVTQFLREEYAIEVQLDLQSLDDLGISPDDPIDVNLQRISLASALRIMLTQLDLTYIISDEVVLITSEEEALTRLTVAVYPVGDLLVRKGTQAPDYEDSAAAMSGESAEGAAADEQHADPSGYNMDGLIGVILSTIASDTWVHNGGPEAEIQPLQPGLLVISQTQDVHQQIANLLTALRAARNHEAAIEHSPSKSESTNPSGDANTGGATDQADHGGGGMF